MEELQIFIKAFNAGMLTNVHMFVTLFSLALGNWIGMSLYGLFQRECGRLLVGCVSVGIVIASSCVIAIDLPKLLTFYR